MNDETILESYTRLCSESVKKKLGSIAADCHNASEALADILSEKGYPATRIKVQVMLPKSTCFDHSVVLALNEYVLDPTFGQFQDTGILSCPDYFIFKEQGMFEINDRFARGESNSLASVRVSDSKVSYFRGSSPLKEKLRTYLN